MTAVVSENQGDYESIKVFRELTPTSVRIAGSAEAPDDSGEVREINVARVVLREDLRNSKVLRTYFHEFDAQEFPGTTPMFSAAMVNDVRSTGQTHATYLEIEPAFGTTVVSRTMTGTLKRVGAGAFTVTVPVNGVPQALRALHMAGRLDDDGDGADFDYVVLDDPDNPLILRGKGPAFSTSVTRIEFPVPDVRPVELEVDSIHERLPVLRQSILERPGGRCRHREFDSLSRRRSQSVKAALVQRYGIDGSRLSTGGFGASQPQAKNDTPEGRARNRRVELTRQ